MGWDLVAGMDVNGKDYLKLPLLQPPDAVVLDIKSVPSVDQGVRTITFKIGGMECASCSTSIESVLLELNGVKSAVVSALQGQAVVKYVPALVGVSISLHVYIEILTINKKLMVNLSLR